MSARQLIVLAVAFIAAIGALVVIRGMNASPPERTEAAAPIEGQQVLVVTKDVPQGSALTGGDLSWRLFPDASVGEQFIRQSQQPDAATQLQGAIARRAFAAGEPVTEGALVLPEGRGFLAAMLTPGYRAVAIEIETVTSAGGFIQPNDHVDVLSTVEVEVEGQSESARTNVILADVRVLSIGDNVTPQTSGDAPARADANFALLELSPQDARILAAADAQGSISLALRGVAAETADMRVPSAAPVAQQGQGSGGVTIHAFGRVGG